MLDFLLEGGWGMWPILIFGLVTLGASLRFAYAPDRRSLPFLITMSITILIVTVHATVSDLAAVFRTMSRIIQTGKEATEVHAILFEGLKESTRPASLAGLFLTLAWLLISIGTLRLPTNPPPTVNPSAS